MYYYTPHFVYATEVNSAAGAVIVDIVYGFKVKPENDHYIELAERGLQVFVEAADINACLVNLVPIRASFLVAPRSVFLSLHAVKYLPTWLPGGGFHQRVLEWRKALFDMASVPFQDVKTAMVSSYHM